MEQNTTFSYSYCAKDNKEVLQIREKYLPQSVSKLDELKKLDENVKTPADIFAYLFGAVSAVIMGSGMSLVMTDIGAMLGLADTLLPGIIIGVIGLFLAVINYPLYKGILGSRRKKYANKILALSEEIMKGE